MEISKAQFKIIEHLLPVQRGNVTLHNHQVLNAILYVAGDGCKWRELPAVWAIGTQFTPVLIAGQSVGCWIPYSSHCRKRM